MEGLHGTHLAKLKFSLIADNRNIFTSDEVRAMIQEKPAIHISQPILSWLLGQDRIIKISG
jgi:hypothetical protein